jgi:hypothetical protein
MYTGKLVENLIQTQYMEVLVAAEKHFDELRAQGWKVTYGEGAAWDEVILEAP